MQNQGFALQKWFVIGITHEKCGCFHGWRPILGASPSFAVWNHGIQQSATCMILERIPRIPTPHNVVPPFDS